MHKGFEATNTNLPVVGTCPPAKVGSQGHLQRQTGEHLPGRVDIRGAASLPPSPLALPVLYWLCVNVTSVAAWAGAYETFSLCFLSLASIQTRKRGGAFGKRGRAATNCGRGLLAPGRDLGNAGARATGSRLSPALAPAGALPASQQAPGDGARPFSPGGEGPPGTFPGLAEVRSRRSAPQGDPGTWLPCAGTGLLLLREAACWGPAHRQQQGGLQDGPRQPPADPSTPSPCLPWPEGKTQHRSPCCSFCNNTVSRRPRQLRPERLNPLSSAHPLLRPHPPIAMPPRSTSRPPYLGVPGTLC